MRNNMTSTIYSLVFPELLRFKRSFRKKVNFKIFVYCCCGNMIGRADDISSTFNHYLIYGTNFRFIELKKGQVMAFLKMFGTVFTKLLRNALESLTFVILFGNDKPERPCQQGNDEVVRVHVLYLLCDYCIFSNCCQHVACFLNTSKFVVSHVLCRLLRPLLVFLIEILMESLQSRKLKVI